MPLLLVRHAKAGNRQDWAGDDRLRPLSAAGARQADELARRLATYRPNDILGAVLEVPAAGTSPAEVPPAARPMVDPMRAVIESRPASGARTSGADSSASSSASTRRPRSR